MTDEKSEKAEVVVEREDPREIVQFQAMSGPIPPPQILAQYNEISPDLADRIVKMAENEGDHRRGLETRGQYLAFGIAIVGMVSATVAIVSGHAVAGTLFAGGTLVSLATVVIYDRRSSGEE